MRGFVIDCAALSVLSSSNAGISVKMYTSLASCKLFPEFFINILQEFLWLFRSVATEKKRKRGISSLTGKGNILERVSTQA
jgi:hypothetical protein